MNDVGTIRRDPALPQPQRPAPSRWRTPVRWFLLVTCLSLGVMWVYALFFASQEAPDRVRDATWRARVQTICAGYEQQRQGLANTSGGYIKNPTAAQMVQRAVLVDQATDLLQSAVRDSTAVLPASAHDQQVVAKYVGYWNTLIADRRAYTAALRTGTMVPYSESLVNGTPVTNLITDFTVVNGLSSCTPPNELGVS